MKDALLTANGMILFPISFGISSEVFKSGECMFFNNFNPITNKKFAPDVDNIESLKEIDNLCFFTIQRDNYTPIGVVQLFNKSRPIMASDIKKMDAIKRFFGGCV